MNEDPMHTVAADVLARTRSESAAAIRSVRRRLRSLRRAARLCLALDGLAALLCAAVALAALSLLVDRTLQMDRAQRAVSLGLGAALLLAVAGRRLVRPLLARLDDECLCLRVEARHPRLAEALISAVQFANMVGLDGSEPPLAFLRRPGSRPGAAPASVSMRLLLAAVERGARVAQEVDFLDVLDRRRRTRALGAAAGAAAVGVLAVVLMPTTMGLWFRRNVLLADVSWPHRTRLSLLGVEDGALRVPRGDDLEVTVVADPAGIVPTSVLVDYRPLDGRGGGSDRVNRTGAAEFRWRLSDVQSPFQLRARGGDDATGWVPVRLLERPEVEELTLFGTPPAYTGVPPGPLPLGAGATSVLQGSRLEVRGRANKPLASATLAHRDLGSIAMTVSGGADFRVEIPPERLASGTYSIRLEDPSGLTSRRPRPFVLRIAADRKPEVRATLQGASELIVPGATIPVRCEASDDFAVAAVRLMERHGPSESSAEVPTPRPIPELEPQIGRSTVSGLFRFDTAPLDLAPGFFLSFTVEAEDNDTVSGPKRGASGGFSLRVVSREEFLQHLLRREQELRQEFERVLRDQRRLLDDSRVLEARRSASRADGDDAKALADAEKRQRLVRGRCQTIADRFADLLEELRNNRIEGDGGPMGLRLGGQVIAPLRALARGAVSRAADHLDAARRSASDREALGRALADAMGEQQRAVAAMEEILSHITRWESYEQAVRLLREVLEGQTEVSEETRKELERRIRDILRP